MNHRCKNNRENASLIVKTEAKMIHQLVSDMYATLQTGENYIKEDV